MLPVYANTEETGRARAGNVGNATSHDATLADWLGIVRAEYLEMPGLKLTLAQARRLWHLDETTCSALFDALVGAAFLRRTDGGEYVRAVD